MNARAVECRHAGALGDRGTRVGGQHGQAADPTALVECTVRRMPEPTEPEPADGRRQLVAATKLDGEPVRGDRAPLRVKLLELGLGVRDPQASDRPERIAGQLADPRQRLFGEPHHVGQRLLVVRKRRPAQGEPAVPATRARARRPALQDPHGCAREG